MSTVIPIEEAHAHLKELIEGLSPGDEVLITMNHKVVAMLATPKPSNHSERPAPGLCKAMILEISPDFDEPLDDMKEYMN